MKSEVAEQNLNLLITGAIGLVVAGMVIAFGAQVTSDVQNDFTADTFEANATQSALEGMDSLAGKLPSVGIILGAVVIIALLVAGFRGLR